MMKATDEMDVELSWLVPPAAAGDQAALQSVIDIIYPPILRYCRLRVPATRYPTPEDLAQEICLAVTKALPGYKDQGRPFMAFVYRIASNKIVDARRAQGRDLSSPTDEIPDNEVTTETPESLAIERSACNEVSELLDVLGEKARKIVSLRIFGGYSAEETAEIVGSTAGAVRVAQFRALAKMRSVLEEREGQRHDVRTQE